MQGACLTEEQALEVLAMEDGFSRILQLYGDRVDAVKCQTCDRHHKFSL